MNNIKLLLSALIILVINCSDKNQIDEQPLKFAFITCCTQAKFFNPVKKGMNDAANMLGVSCDFMGTEGVDLVGQADMVKKAVNNGYNGIALNIIDPVAFDNVIQRALDAGVPVVGFNVDDQATPNARLSSVNQQLYTAGQSLATHLLPFISENEHVLMTMHDEGVSALEDRLQGMQEILQQKNVSWSILITGSGIKNGTEKIASFLKKHPDVKIVLATGQADTEAAGKAIEKYFSSRDYWSAGFDLSPKTLELIKNGFIRCTVDQQPYIQGFYPVVQLVLYVRYGINPSNMDAGAVIIDKSNVESVMALTEQGYR